MHCKLSWYISYICSTWRTHCIYKRWILIFFKVFKLSIRLLTSFCIPLSFSRYWILTLSCLHSSCNGIFSLEISSSSQSRLKRFASTYEVVQKETESEYFALYNCVYYGVVIYISWAQVFTGCMFPLHVPFQFILIKTLYLGPLNSRKGSICI